MNSREPESEKSLAEPPIAASRQRDARIPEFIDGTYQHRQSCVLLGFLTFTFPWYFPAYPTIVAVEALFLLVAFLYNIFRRR